MQEEVAADLHADDSSQFNLGDVPALNPEARGEKIDWQAYGEMYETGSFPAVAPLETK